MNIESKLVQMRNIDHQLKVLSAQYAALKDEVIAEHFATSEQFVGSEGLVLATYKKQTRLTFMASEFKKDHPDMHKLYSADQVINVFLLKK